MITLVHFSESPRTWNGLGMVLSIWDRKFTLVPTVPHAVPTLFRSLFYQAWVESLLGLVVSPLSGREDFSLSVPGSVLSALCVLSHFIFSPLWGEHCVISLSPPYRWKSQDSHEPSLFSRVTNGVAISLFGNCLRGGPRALVTTWPPTSWMNRVGAFSMQQNPKV